MSLFKCKMCGGSLEITGNETVAECEYCGTKQTLPGTRDDAMTNLFNRANNLRMKCEFDKALQLYEKIIEQNDSEAEAHWGAVLCKYGIEYVEDPKTLTRIPTCHRTSYDAVTTDADYLAAIDYSDTLQQTIYEQEARAIDRIQRDILAVVEQEKPFDVFICYKETDENGKRTVDSTIANDIYYQLTEEGFKVFYAAITLEDKLGQEYEPYIFAALNSAKVMLVLGTKPEYFNAVWVKNEWSRYLKLMKSDRQKLLIPCYRDMDAYDLPEEFAHLQSQDMSKIGFINDVVRGIKKVVQKDEPVKAAVVKETVVTGGNANTEPLLKRVFIFLSDRNWESADEYCEKVLDIDPECAEAYLGKLMVELKVCEESELATQNKPFDDNPNFNKIMRFGNEDLCAKLTGYHEYIVKRIEEDHCEETYIACTEMMEQAKITISENVSKAINEFSTTIRGFERISQYKDAQVLADQCREFIYTKSLERFRLLVNQEINNVILEERMCAETIKAFEFIAKYKDANELTNKTKELAKQIKEKRENQYSKCENLHKELKKLQAKTEEIHRLAAKRDGSLRVIASRLIDEANKSDFLFSLIELKSKYDKKIEALEVQMQTEIQESAQLRCDISRQISELEARYSTLGFFSGKEKKEIANKINTLKGKLNNIGSEEDIKASFSSRIQEMQNEMDKEIALKGIAAKAEFYQQQLAIIGDYKSFTPATDEEINSLFGRDWRGDKRELATKIHNLITKNFSDKYFIACNIEISCIDMRKIKSGANVANSNKFNNISLLLVDKNTNIPVLAIWIVDDYNYDNRPIKNSMKACEENGIIAHRYFVRHKGWDNTSDYIVNRTTSALTLIQWACYTSDYIVNRTTSALNNHPNI